MFCTIPNLPPFVIGVEMKEKVTKEDFESILIPAVKKVSSVWKALNLLIVLKTELKNFTAGAWKIDIETNLRYYWKWNKICIVTSSGLLEKVFTSFSAVLPNDVRSFSDHDLSKAIEWISVP